MSYLKRATVTRIRTERITAPQFHTDAEGKKYPVISFMGIRGNQEHLRVAPKVILEAAGENVVGKPPEGFDRLTDHVFILHCDKNEVVIGIDVIPARMRGNRVVPVSEEGVKTVKLRWHEDNGCVYLTQRTYNLKANETIKLIKELDDLAAKAKKSLDLKEGQLLMKGRVRVESVGSNTAEFLYLGKGGGKPAFSSGDDDDDEEG